MNIVNDVVLWLQEKDCLVPPMSWHIASALIVLFTEGGGGVHRGSW